MFKCTYFGHQGWLFSTGDHTILVDPIFHPHFGRGPQGGRFPTYPPRIFDYDKFPALDAVIITHEHEDHFDIPSLNILARHTPIYLSARSSVAAFTALKEMGFTNVNKLEPGKSCTFGNIFFMTFAPDHVRSFLADEWDTSPFFVLDTRGHGSFFTPVDVWVTRPMIELVNHFVSKIIQMQVEAGKRVEEKLKTLLFWMGGLEWGTMPKWEKIVEDGAWVRPDPKEYEENSGAARDELRAGVSLKAIPGQTVCLVDQEIASVEPSTAFMAAPPKSKWGEAERWRFQPDSEKYVAIQGETKMNDFDWKKLEASLQPFAAFLYGRRIFQMMYSLEKSTMPRVPNPTFALFMRSDSETRVYEYDPAANDFVRATGDKKFEDYALWHECWAKDWNYVVDGGCEARILSMGHSRFDAVEPFSKNDIISYTMCLYFHPLNHPMACLRRFREIYNNLEVDGRVNAAPGGDRALKKG